MVMDMVEEVRWLDGRCRGDRYLQLQVFLQSRVEDNFAQDNFAKEGFGGEGKVGSNIA